MTKARTIAELHYPNKAGNRFDEKHRQSRINALEKLITKQLILSGVSHQRELLIRYNEYLRKQYFAERIEPDKVDVETFLINCG